MPQSPYVAAGQQAQTEVLYYIYYIYAHCLDGDDRWHKSAPSRIRTYAHGSGGRCGLCADRVLTWPDCSVSDGGSTIVPRMFRIMDPFAHGHSGCHTGGSGTGGDSDHEQGRLRGRVSG